MEISETGFMKREAALLNLVCVVVALGFVALAVVNALVSPSFLTTDNLFVTMVCMLMALMFIVNPLLYLKDEGRLPIPFLKGKALKGAAVGAGGRALPPSQPLLDAKGRAVPPDVKSMVANMERKQP
ncbi:MAG TPA: hypothetical protein VGO56_20440 [Pyrinomonadaceae bacterium]|jgi:hypothetical protein|nr:hypothetical protein [Pyrinomonadaceae bacterium]